MFITLAEAERLSQALADQILKSFGRPDLLVGIANGAILPTKIAADHLGVPYEIVRVRRQGSRIKQRLVFIKKAFRIPGRAMTFGPLMWFWRKFQDRYSSLEQTDDAFNFSINGRTVVLIDDEIVTGASVKYVRDELIARGCASVRIAVIGWYRGKGDSGDFAPDTYLIAEHKFYPWSHNSPDYSAFESWLGENNLRLWQ